VHESLILFTLLLITTLITQGVYFYFLNCFYKRDTGVDLLIGIFLLAIIHIIQFFFPFQEAFLILFSIILSMLVIRVVFSTSLTQAYYFSFLYNLYILTFKGCYFAFLSVFNILPIEVIYNNKIVYFSGVIFSLILTSLLLILLVEKYISPNRGKLLKVIDKRFRQLIIAYTSLSFLSIISFASMSLEGNLIIQLCVFIIVGMSVFNSSLTFYLNSLDLTEMEVLKKQSNILENRITNKEKYYEQFTAEIERFRYLEHDYKNLMGVLENMMDEEEYSILSESGFIKDFANEIKVIENINGKYSNNLLLDELLLEIENICVLNRIEFSGRLNFPNQLKVSTFELIRVVINILDNAISANLKLPSDERYIRFITKSNGEWLTINFKNAFLDVVTISEGVPLTTKADHERHGFGLKIVRQIIEQWEGVMTIEPDEYNKEFSISISIKI